MNSLILDNLRMHHSKPVKAWLEKNPKRVTSVSRTRQSAMPLGIFTGPVNK
jgi:hypothetical protein